MLQLLSFAAKGGKRGVFTSQSREKSTIQFMFSIYYLICAYDGKRRSSTKLKHLFSKLLN
jgi:hypothetical protein